MKTKLLLALLIGCTSLSFSQKLQNLDNDKPIHYYLVNKENDTTITQGEIGGIEEIQRGFFILNENNGERQIVNPDNFNYLFLKNSEGKTFNLKSLPIERKKITLQKNNSIKNRNAFMTILIENSENDLKKGKLDLYLHEFAYDTETSNPYWDGEGEIRVKSNTFYFQDLNGLHQIYSKSDFKHFPKILGKNLYKKMMNSDKEKEQFLRDYFTEYNKKIDTLLQ